MHEGISTQAKKCTGALESYSPVNYARRMGRRTVNSNVKTLRVQRLGLKQAAFAELIGSEQSYISKWERDVVPGSRALAKMAELAGVTVDQFMDEPLPASKNAVTPNSAETSGSEVVSLQKLDLSLSMGPGTLIDDWVEAEPVAFDLAFLRAITRAPSSRLKLVTGMGDSMYPTLTHGDAIMIDTTDRALARQDGIYWINLYGAAGIKRLRTIGLGKVLVKSDNPAVDDQEVEAEDLRIEGRAIWVARGL